MWADLFVASRSLRRSPIFAATAIAALTLGIGASSAIFSIVHAVLLRPLPFRDPGQLVRIWEANPVEGSERAPVSAANVNDWRSRSRTFDDLALFNTLADPTVLGLGDASIQAKQAVVTPNLFALLGVHTTVGRGFDVVPDRRTALDGTEVILSHRLWLRAFGGDSGVIGRSVRIEGAPGNVVVGARPRDRGRGRMPRAVRGVWPQFGTLRSSRRRLPRRSACWTTRRSTCRGARGSRARVSRRYWCSTISSTCWRWRRGSPTSCYRSPRSECSRPAAPRSACEENGSTRWGHSPWMWTPTRGRPPISRALPQSGCSWSALGTCTLTFVSRRRTAPR